MLRLRFRALRDQLGYKLPALPFQARATMNHGDDGLRRETLFGDDAEADAFVYSLYADVLAGTVAEETLIEVCERGRVYPDVIATALRYARLLEPGDVVERILIHLERQSPPGQFQIYGRRAVPFYNYLQAAFVVHEDGRLTPEGVMRVAVELVVQHRFDGNALARSYLDLARRGHLRGSMAGDLARSLDEQEKSGKLPAASELRVLAERLPEMGELAREHFAVAPPKVEIDSREAGRGAQPPAVEEEAVGAGRRARCASGRARCASGLARRASGLARRPGWLARRPSGLARRAGGPARRASRPARRASRPARRASRVARRASRPARRASVSALKHPGLARRPPASRALPCERTFHRGSSQNRPEPCVDFASRGTCDAFRQLRASLNASEGPPL